MLHNANIHLGSLAAEQDDAAAAAAYLLAAARVAGSPRLTSYGPDLSLADRLLGMGQREAVVEYLLLERRLWPPGRRRLRRWEAAIARREAPALVSRP